MLDEPDAPRDPTASPHHRGRRAAIVVIALIALLVVGVIGGYGAFLNHTVTANIHHANLLPEPAPTSSSSGTGGSASAGRSHQAGPAGAQNILLIGSDARAGLSGGRSDVIILAHIPRDRKQVYLVHFPRDLYVDIPGHGQNKINAAYAFGGPPLLVATVQQLVGVHIDHAAQIGFEGFKSMTDALGGVDVYAEQPSTEGGVDIHRGINHLDGAQALVFVRERHQLSQGDISRGRRQMAFLKALLSKTASTSTLTNPIRLAETLNAATRYLAVDRQFSIGDIRSLALSLRGVRGNDVVTITAPFNGFATTSAGASIDVLDTRGMARLGADLAGDTMQNYPAGSQIP